MQIAYFLFWLSFSVLFFCYIGYGVVMFCCNKIAFVLRNRQNKSSAEKLLPVTLIVPAFNEARIIEKKIENTLSLDYPEELLKVIFVTDGSTDGTEKKVKQYSRFTSLHLIERKGKYAALKRAMKEVRTPVVIFSDANAILNNKCIHKIVKHYENEKIGGVAGEKRILHDHHTSALGEAEGMYWQYESFMKKQDADLFTVVGAAGELFSIRTDLFKEMDNDIVLDDFVISMQVCLQGYRIAYEPEAFSTEAPSASLAEEEKRKVRISAGAYQSIGYLKKALNIFRYPVLCFQYFFRRLLRWTACPWMILLLLVSNFVLADQATPYHFYKWFFYMQLIFYLLALSGWFFVRSGWRTGVLNIPFYFVFMNYCLVKGFFIFLQGNATSVWKKSVRQDYANES